MMLCSCACMRVVILTVIQVVQQVLLSREVQFGLYPDGDGDGLTWFQRQVRQGVPQVPAYELTKQLFWNPEEERVRLRIFRPGIFLKGRVQCLVLTLKQTHKVLNIFKIT